MAAFGISSPVLKVPSRAVSEGRLPSVRVAEPARRPRARAAARATRRPAGPRVLSALDHHDTHTGEGERLDQASPVPATPTLRSAHPDSRSGHHGDHDPRDRPWRPYAACGAR